MGAEIEYLRAPARHRGAADLPVAGRLSLRRRRVARLSCAVIARRAAAGDAQCSRRQGLALRVLSLAPAAGAGRRGRRRVAQDGPPGITAPTVLPAVRSGRAGLHARRRACRRCWPSRRTTSASSCRASAAGSPRPRRIAASTIASRSPTTMPAQMIEQVEALARRARSARWSPRRSIRSSLAPQPAAGHLVGRLCRHGRAAARDLAAQRAAISDRQGAGRRGGRLHPRRSSAARPRSCC